jgi:hypothetical protein
MIACGAVFSNILSRDQLESLALADANEVVREVQVRRCSRLRWECLQPMFAGNQEYFLDYLALNPNFFSLDTRGLMMLPNVGDPSAVRVNT